jgi:hypothetical protein
MKNAIYICVVLLCSCAAKVAPLPVTQQIPPRGLVCMCAHLPEGSTYNNSAMCESALNDVGKLNFLQANDYYDCIHVSPEGSITVVK